MVAVAAVGSIARLFDSSARSSSVLATVGSLLKILHWSEGILCDVRCGLLVYGVVGSHAVMMLGDSVVKKLMSRQTAICTNMVVSNPLTGCMQAECGPFHLLCLPHVKCVVATRKEPQGWSQRLDLPLA
jgi:hypothetical protein